MPPDERRAHAGVVGEEAAHRRELVADGGGLALLLEQRETGEVQPLVVRRRGEAGLDAGERPAGVPGPQPVGDEDEVGHDVGRILGEDPLGHRHRRRPVGAAAEVDGRLQRADSGVARVELEGAGGVGDGGVEVLDLERELGQPPVSLGEAGADLDELLVLAEGVAGLALRAAERGIAQPRLGMIGVQAEDVAELDRRPLVVAVLEIGEGALVVGLGAFVGAVAAGEGDGEEEGGEKGEAHGTAPGSSGAPDSAGDARDVPRGLRQDDGGGAARAPVRIGGGRRPLAREHSPRRG